nr:uncharacterized protein LOC111515627 [Leptinotarsa decemlineata]XP_023027611.1 uncharacterized protein LOC111515627 [Leptinotarsa decemlineata]
MYRLRSLVNYGMCRCIYRLPKTNFCTKGKPKEEILDDGPIKFSSSAARTYKAHTTRTGENESRLWYEPYVIVVSMTVFMIYFCILREENDIDADLSTSLYSRIHGLEEFQLKQSLEYNKKHGLPTKDIIDRLNEIEEEKSSISS